MMKNMSEGKPATVLLKFSLPMLLSVAFLQFYSISDSMIAGRFIGPNALAAVGASYPVTMIFMAVASGMSIGITVVVSTLFGGERLAEMKTCVSTALILCAGISLILTGVGLLACRPILRALSTPANIMSDSALFLNVYVLGLLFLFMYNACNGIFMALGDSATPLYFLIASSVGNVALDLLFVAVIGMGVEGVAWATFIAQGICSVLAFFTLLRRVRKIRGEEPSPLFSGFMAARISRIAIPSILQQSFVSVGNLFVQNRINTFGSDVIAGYAAAIKLNTFVLTCFGTMSNATSSFTAQNIGAEHPERVRAGTRAALKIGLIIGAPGALLLIIFGRTLTGFFVEAGSSAKILDVGEHFLKIVAPFYVIILMKIILDGVLRGAGIMNLFMIATLTDLVLRVVFSFVLSAFLDETGIWIAWPVGWVIATVMTILFYRYSMKHYILKKPAAESA